MIEKMLRERRIIIGMMSIQTVVDGDIWDESNLAKPRRLTSHDYFSLAAKMPKATLTLLLPLTRLGR